MEYIDIVIKQIKDKSIFSITDLLKLKNEIDTHFSKPEMDRVAIELKKSGSGLMAVKHIKDITGWSLKDSKDYYDNLTQKI